ncbi:MAG: UBA/THIF-type binding protein [Gemmatimonadetes bacterium]|nr:UBA/THIF-type binding protein [Gemmatimonadota bacterium]
MDSTPPELTDDERLRYSRHLLLPQVGLEGQRRLKSARVLVVGAGGLGSPVALYLAAAGVGTLGLVDFDVVDLSNLQRQLLHGTADVGRSKLDSARDRLLAVNPHVVVEPHAVRLTAATALEIVGAYDVVVDGTDNFPTRYLVNDACAMLRIPLVYGSIFRFEGQASVFCTAEGPCYRCLFPEPPPPDSVPSCAEGGVLGVLPGMIGTIQAAEALKLVLGIGQTLAGRLLLVDALTMEHRTVQLQRDPECPACGTRTLTTLIDYDAFCAGAHPAQPSGAEEIAPSELAALLSRGEVELIDVREPHEWDAGHVSAARHIPLAALGQAMATLDAGRATVVMCRSGGRGDVAARQLRAAGVARVRNLAGGLMRWEAEGRETVRGS